MTRALHQEFAEPPGGTGRERHRANYRRKRLLWLLDRLASKEESTRFEPFIANAFGVFAWGRRLNPDQRHLLIERAKSASPGEDEPYILAWCEAFPDAELPSLLNWVEPWEPVFRVKGISPLVPRPEREFFSRFKDRAIRRSHMCARLVAACQRFRDGREFDRAVVRGSIHSLLGLLLRDTNAPCPTNSIPDSAEDWKAWLDQTLTTPAFADVRLAAGEFLSWYGQSDIERTARQLWVFCHGPNDWRQLHEFALQYDDWFIYDRLAEIVPSDRLEEWDSLVLHQSTDSGQMRAFCCWLPAEYAEVLRSHFDHPDADWGGCAYHAYLAKAPEAVLQHHWRRRDDLPGWQVRLIDRRLFAPHSIRPSPVVEDIQDAEWDFRLDDPFTRRGI